MRIKKFIPYLAIVILLIPITAVAIQRGAWNLGSIEALLDDVANWLYIIGFAVALIMIIIGGISYMTSGGNEDKQAKAKKTIVTGLIGAAIILLAGIILDTIANFLGVSPPT